MTISVVNDYICRSFLLVEWMIFEFLAEFQSFLNKISLNLVEQSSNLSGIYFSVFSIFIRLGSFTSLHRRLFFGEFSGRVARVNMNLFLPSAARFFPPI